MTTTQEIAEMIDAQGTQIKTWQAKQESKYSELERSLSEVEKKAGRPFAGASGDAKRPGESWIDTKTGESILALRHSESLAALQGKSSGTPTLGRILRGLVCGSNASDARELENERRSMNIANDPTGGYVVEGEIAAEWVDALRSASVLSRAGARTIAMPSGELGVARVDTDPVVTFHGESGAITSTKPVFGRTNLSAKTAVCVIPFSVELAQDSANLEEQLGALVTRSMAAALDSAGLIGTATNAAAAPTGLVNLSGRNSVLSVGSIANHDFLIDAYLELLQDNVDMATISGLVANPTLWGKLMKLRTGISSDVTPLRAPDEIASLPRFWTTAMPSATAILADWSSVVIGIRQQLTIKLVDSRMASNLDGTLVCYLRADVASVRPVSLCTIEGIS